MQATATAMGSVRQQESTTCALELVGPGVPTRLEVERFIHDRFLRTYDAHVSEFMPLLLTARCTGAISGVVGLRPAHSHRLFVENYFDETVEQRLSAAAGSQTARHELLEIGNLVANWRAGSYLLMVLLPLLADRLGYTWLVFTATPEVRKLIARLQFPLLSLGAADGARLGAHRPAWGRYYEGHPEVMAGAIKPALARIASHETLQRTAAAMEPQLQQLIRPERSRLNEQPL